MKTFATIGTLVVLCGFCGYAIGDTYGFYGVALAPFGYFLGRGVSAVADEVFIDE